NASIKGPGESGHSPLHLKQVSLCKPSRRTDFLALQPEKNWLVKQEFQNLKSSPESWALIYTQVIFIWTRYLPGPGSLSIRDGLVDIGTGAMYVNSRLIQEKHAVQERCGFRTEELCTQSRAEHPVLGHSSSSLSLPHVLCSSCSLWGTWGLVIEVHGGAAHSAVQGRENLNLWEQLQVTPKQDQIRDWVSTCSHSSLASIPWNMPGEQPAYWPGRTPPPRLPSACPWQSSAALAGSGLAMHIPSHAVVALGDPSCHLQMGASGMEDSAARTG
ncbi:hypothetical protein EI555_006183, partial [Monodon monoceros]